MASKKQSTLSKFFYQNSSKKNGSESKSKKTDPSIPKKTSTKYKVTEVASPFRKRPQSDESSPENKPQAKRAKPSEEATEGSPDDNLTASTSADSSRDLPKVTDSTLNKLASFISTSVIEERQEKPTISLEELKEKLGYDEDKISQDSGAFCSTAPGTDEDDEPSTSLAKFSNPKSSKAQKTPKGPSSGIGAGSKMKYTPLEQQFVEIKAQYQDAVLFVECGYKFRFFGEDAEIAARELNIYCHQDHSFMTASIPVHRLHVHVRRLVAKGHKVGVVKQTETAALKAAGDNRSAPFSRRLTALYTKSTLIGEDVDPVFTSTSGENTPQGGASNAYLMNIYEPDPEESNSGKPHKIAIVAIQPATGDLLYDEFDDHPGRSELETRVAHISPVELLLPQTLSKHTEKLVTQVTSYSTTPDDRLRVERLPDAVFCQQRAVETLTDFYSGGGEGDDDRLSEILRLPPAVVSCLAGLLTYLQDFKLQNVLKLTSQFSRFSEDAGHMTLPARTVQNLELFVNATDGRHKGSLCWVLDHTRTRFGGRELRRWINKPLLSVSDISARQEAVQCILTGHCSPVARVLELLRGLPDLEKGLATIYHKKCSTGEFLSVCRSLLSVLSAVRAEASGAPGTDTEPGGALRSSLLHRCLAELPEFLGDVEQWTSALDHSAAKDGDKTKLFRREHDFPAIVARKAEIAAVLRELSEHRKEVRITLRQPSLEYKSVAGTEFLVEVKNTNLKVVPNNWTKIASTKAVTRYHTPVILAATRKLSQLREQLSIDCDRAWQSFLESFEASYPRYKHAVRHLATLDCIHSLATVAKQDGYCRPRMSSERSALTITAGRHPVVSGLLGETEQYVANDTQLDTTVQRCMIITGPNMGGKSSYIRQVALITIMAQIGSFVPAESAEMGIVDAVYTRMGASDELFRGRSTFMVELAEAAAILSGASPRSLVILDEVGRGTSTHDGVAIAMATLRYFVQDVRCLTLFVTHYPPITEMDLLFPVAIGNHHMAYMVNSDAETRDYDEVTFLYQLVDGKAAGSYGLNVAQLADIPSEILQRAALKARQLQDAVNKTRRNKSLFCRLCSSDPAVVMSAVEDLKMNSTSPVSEDES